MILDKANPDTVTLSDCRYGRTLHLKQDRYIGRALTEFGEYSESEVELWRNLLTSHSIVADVGANIGAHTMALASLVPNGAVFAFEPLPFLFKLLCGNLALNGITNAFPFNVAVGKVRGSITVPAIDYRDEENYGGVALGAYEQGNKVSLVKLDDVLPKVDLIKADVEGMEQAVFEGASRLITECKPVLYFENNPDRSLPPGTTSPAQAALIAYVQSLGYDLWWHFAPHYNPDNYAKNPVNSYEEGLASFNVVGFASHPDNAELMGSPPIAPHGR